MTTEFDYKNRVEIESLHIVSSYSLIFGQITNDNCTLCGHNLLSPSPIDLKNSNLSVIVSIGVCGHAFHKSCIDEHIRKNIVCPIDKTPWNILKYINIDNHKNR